MTVKIPSALRSSTHGEAVLRETAQAVGKLLQRIDVRYPGFRSRLCDANGDLKRFVNVFVNGHEIRQLQGLQTPLSDSDDVTIIPAMAGGMG